MTDIPSPLTYSTITGRFVSIAADSSDAGNLPDLANLSGTVTITPSVRRIHILGDEDGNGSEMAIAQTVTGMVVDGALLGPDGVTPLRVLATDSPGINPVSFQYTAVFSLSGAAAQPATVVFNAPGGTTVDLTSVIPADSSPAIQTVVSEATRIAAEAAAAAAAQSAQDAADAAASAGGGGGTVFSVNTKTGSVVLNQDDIADGTTAKQYTATEKTKLAGIAAGAEVNVNADWTAGSGDAQILNKPTLGTAAAAASSDFATAAQGAKADSALQVAPVTSVASKTGAVSLVKGDVGLGNVDNTADSAKPVSSAQQTALDAKVPLTRTVAGHALSADVTLVKGDVGLGNVDNTSDSGKPVSTAQQTALDGKLATSAFLNGLTGVWIGTQAQYAAIGSPSATVLYAVTP